MQNTESSTRWIVFNCLMIHMWIYGFAYHVQWRRIVTIWFANREKKEERHTSKIKNANRSWNERDCELMHPFLMKFMCFGFRSEMRAHLPSVCWLFYLCCWSTTMCVFVGIRVNNFFFRLDGMCFMEWKCCFDDKTMAHCTHFPDDLHRRNDENRFALRHSYTFAAAEKQNHIWRINKFRNMQSQCAACNFSDVNPLANRISFVFFSSSLSLLQVSRFWFAPTQDNTIPWCMCKRKRNKTWLLRVPCISCFSLRNIAESLFYFASPFWVN